jgi:hypothetical protein
VHHGDLNYFQVDFSLVVALLLVGRQLIFIQRFFFLGFVLDDGPIKIAHCNPKKEKKEKRIELGRHPI